MIRVGSSEMLYSTKFRGNRSTGLREGLAQEKGLGGFLPYMGEAAILVM